MKPEPQWCPMGPEFYCLSFLVLAGRGVLPYRAWRWNSNGYSPDEVVFNISNEENQ